MDLVLAVRYWVDGEDPHQLVSDVLCGAPAATGRYRFHAGAAPVTH